MHYICNMMPTITEIEPIQLAASGISMSFENNRTFELWSNFMPKRKHIGNRIGDVLYNLYLYPEAFFTSFDPATEFQKLAAVPVSATGNFPEGITSYNLGGGLYAMFVYKGDGSDISEFYRKIFMEWLPTSGYTLDNRPHFEVMGVKYNRGSADSEEEVWIPLKTS